MLERIFWFYGQLKKNAYPTAARYRERFEISMSTFKRDLAFLRDRLGAPIEYDRHRRGYFLTDASFELPPFWFNAHQLLFVLGLCRQMTRAVHPLPREILDFRRRVEALLAMHFGPRILQAVSFENVEWSRCDTHILETLVEAILKRRRLCILYHTGYSGKTARREVEPYRLHNYRGTWHLVAFCHYRNEPRIFMLSRMEEAHLLTDGFDRPRFDVAAFLDTAFGIYRGGSLQKAVLRFSPAIARIIRDQIWHQDQEMLLEPDGSLVLTVPVADLTEIRRHALQYGADVEVLEPEELRRQVREEAAQILARYF
ncbi:Predicted DNA-binding transcriptional regulator YafY, contains an HTH and WYL domains [Desulfacinum hydrothermale DSM 13146]|uniref:Predicted DNA-binding transcriptional regulator YafY, contains an HTH and WYL domains n=1 Tax=Desulfacinum hydrothermale DSM 13146 TaxID=1121390 RepID=A0A1W1XVI9_9BACT|nr:WYL domain-containing protein [Desulfacinum hydrothermale]SMC27943.1 Predicted DNA-binding transcriptional regulator YafY, contains an HTH and WYL domains [Desulfacinum hydrothermale DSM 13146]